jgi:hypothetical protein
VIRREQFGTRGIFDNPLFSREGQSRRSLLLFGQQLVNYVLYCGWQWARSLPDVAMYVVAAVRVVGFFLTSRAVAVILAHSSPHRVVAHHGFGLVAYMNSPNRVLAVLEYLPR